MTFSETGNASDIPVQSKTNEQREVFMCDIKAECAQLNLDTTNQWPDVPAKAVEYLTVNCKQPEHLSFAVTEARKLLMEDPHILDDPDMLEVFLPECLEKAEIALKKDVLETEKGANEKRNKTVEVLSNEATELKERITGNLAGEDKAGQLIELIAGVEASDFSVLEKQIAFKHLSMIAATLDQMTTLIDDPAEAAAFQAVVASSNLNLSGGNRVAVFTDLMGQVDASDSFSEATKAKLHVEVFGIPPFRDATEMLGTLEQVRANDGKFLNADGQLVEFNEKNGVPVGRYTVYPDPTDPREYVATVVVGGRTLRVPFSPDDEPNYLDELLSAVMITHVIANRDFQGANRFILGGNGLAAQGITDIRLDEFQVKRAEQLYGAFMGFGSELRTGFPDQNELRSFEWRLQATHIDGDAKTNDNTGRGDLSWEKIGMLQDGQINMHKVEEVGGYLNSKSTALPNHQKLVEQFGTGS